MSEEHVDPEVRLRDLHQTRLSERASQPNWTLWIGVLTFLVIPLLIWSLPRLIAGDEREEKGLERALHYCDDSDLDRCRQRVTERHTFCFAYAEKNPARTLEQDVYGECMHSMYADFYLKVGENILEK